MEPMWKVCEHIMDKRLNVIDLHESLHRCLDRRGTGTAVIEAKLAQHLAHLEQVPFYGLFLDLKKAFNAMDWERCVMILEGYGTGPNMIRLIRNFWANTIMAWLGIPGGILFFRFGFRFRLESGFPPFV